MEEVQFKSRFTFGVHTRIYWGQNTMMPNFNLKCHAFLKDMSRQTPLPNLMWIDAVPHWALLLPRQPSDTWQVSCMGPISSNRACAWYWPCQELWRPACSCVSPHPTSDQILLTIVAPKREPFIQVRSTNTIVWYCGVIICEISTQFCSGIICNLMLHMKCVCICHFIPPPLQVNHMKFYKRPTLRFRFFLILTRHRNLVHFSIL